MASAEMEQIYEMMRAAPSFEGPVEEQRAVMEAMVGTLGPPAGTEIELVEFEHFDAEWLHGPSAGDAGGLLYLHGGGYCIGSVNTHRALAARLSEASGLPVLVPGYRLAPEHPHPAAVEDALTAHRWLLARDLGSQRLAFAGDSAGGGLALAALVALRDEDPALLPAGAALLSPWADLTQSSDSVAANASRDPVVDAAGLDESAAWYAAGADLRSPLLSPRFADLTGLPSLLIQVGEPEILLDDATGTAAAAEEAGVDVTLEVWPEVFHVWHASAGMTPEGDEAVEAVGRFLADRVPPAS
jgi:acetyl esterase/lipase